MYGLTDFVDGPESISMVLIPQNAIITDLSQIENGDFIML